MKLMPTKIEAFGRSVLNLVVTKCNGPLSMFHYQYSIHVLRGCSSEDMPLWQSFNKEVLSLGITISSSTYLYSHFLRLGDCSVNAFQVADGMSPAYKVLGSKKFLEFCSFAQSHVVSLVIT